MNRLFSALALCWEEREQGGLVLHCTETAGHEGQHWHAYSKTSWPSDPNPSCKEDP